MLYKVLRINYVTAELAPTDEVPDDRMGVNHDEKDGEALKRDVQSQRVEAPSQSTGSNESMVQNPSTPLQVSESRKRI